MSSTILVTGDSRGLGAAICRAILQEDGARVIGLSRSSSEATSALATDFPDRYEHLDFDLSAPEEIPQLYTQQLKSRGPISGLVNNAALAYDDLVTNAKLDPIQQMFAVNVVSSILLTKSVLRDMLLHQTRGSIVHITSVSTVTGYKGLSMYAATKGALEAFSLGVAREWGRRGVRSNCVAPGFMDTEMTARLGDSTRDRIYSRTSLGEATRLDSVAETVRFLLSEAAASINGTVVRVDSGAL